MLDFIVIDELSNKIEQSENQLIQLDVLATIYETQLEGAM